MRFSCHSIVVQDYPAKGEHVVFSTRTQAMAKIEEGLKNLIDHFDEASQSEKDRYRQEIEALHRLTLIVRDEEEDRRLLKEFLNNLKYAADDRMLPITVLTTYACNFKCTYCFEESSRSNVKMSRETADATIAWLKEKVLTHRYKKLHLTFYGGEPLLNKPILEYLAVTMKTWCEARGIAFQFLLQTNGFLMTEEVVDRYLKIGLTHVRISVDGVEDSHNRTRPLRGGGPTFQRVLENIVANCRKVPIGISTSYDRGEIGHIEEMLNYFDRLGILPHLDRFVFSPVHPTLGPKGEPEKIVGASCMCNYEDDKLVEANSRIRTLMAKKGLPMKSGMSVSICPVTRDKAGLTVDQEGRLFKCNSMLGHPELSTGNVREHTYNRKHEEFVNLDIWKQCPIDCTYMPMCSGGCRLSSFLKNQNFNTPTCHKPYLNKMAKSFIKENYQKAVAKA